MGQDIVEITLTETSEEAIENPWEVLDQALEQMESLHDEPASDSPMFDRYAALLAED